MSNTQRRARRTGREPTLQEKRAAKNANPKLPDFMTVFRGVRYEIKWGVYKEVKR